MMTDQNAALNQWINASIEVVRAAFVDGAGEDAKARAARVCRVVLQMLETPATPVVAEVAEVPPYQPQQPPSFAHYIAYAMANPEELWRVLGPALGPAAPAAFAMLRNVLARPQPVYR
jgi:hypothetical protein